MDENEYLQTLGEQIANSHARAHVTEEIRAHIEEQAQDYEDAGMSAGEALAESVRQMGDPVSAGASLNRIHRPHFPAVLFGIAVILTLFGIVIQYHLYQTLPPDEGISAVDYMQRTILYNLIGLGIILIGLYGNYMVLMKCSIVLYVLFLVIPFFANMHLMSDYFRSRLVAYHLMLLYPLLYALLLYHFREKGKWAIVWLHLLSFLFVYWLTRFSYSIVFPTLLAFGLLSILLLGICIKRGILQGNKKTLWVLALLPYVGITPVLGFQLHRVHYFSERIRHALDLLFSRNASDADYSGAYIQLALKQDQAQFSLFGSASVSTGLPQEDLYTTYILHSIFLWSGILVGVLVIAALAFFVIYGLRMSLRQSNRLALLLGTAASGILLLELVNALLTNFGINVFYTASLPFLSYGKVSTICNSICVGLLLGIIRNRDVLTE